METLNKFIVDGKITIIPKKQKNKLPIFDYMRAYISEHGEEFTEKELNAIISPVFDDFVLMRRYLVDYGYLTRDKYGTKYKVIEKND